jgi:hypothetical protein
MSKVPDDIGVAPQHRNGVAPRIPPEGSPGRDRRTIFLVVGGILLAFTIGLGLMIFALMLDWQ